MFFPRTASKRKQNEASVECYRSTNYSVRELRFDQRLGPSSRFSPRGWSCIPWPGRWRRTGRGSVLRRPRRPGFQRTGSAAWHLLGPRRQAKNEEWNQIWTVTECQVLTMDKKMTDFLCLPIVWQFETSFLFSTVQFTNWGGVQSMQMVLL